jgi:ADP-heptose:LPS heptosyltransferase
LLHQLYPGARLDIVGHPTALALLEGDERIGERIPYRSSLYHPLPLLPPVRALSVVFKLLWRRYPVVVYLRGSFPFLLLGLTSRLAATKFVVAEPVITRYRKALEALFGPLPHPRARLHIDDGARRFAHELLSAADGASGPRGPRVVIHAAASAATKIWPAERFAELADQLVEKYNAQVHFLGSPDEKTGLERIARLARQRHAVHCSLKIPEVVAVIGAADLFIGNDSGLSHIAAAVDTRLVILWGPANLSMARPEAPPGDCIILYHEVACRNACPEFKCVNPHAFECLTRTQVADVLEAASQLVSPVPAEGRRLPLQLAVAAN